MSDTCLINTSLVLWFNLECRNKVSEVLLLCKEIKHKLIMGHQK